MELERNTLTLALPEVMHLLAYENNEKGRKLTVNMAGFQLATFPPHSTLFHMNLNGLLDIA